MNKTKLLILSSVVVLTMVVVGIFAISLIGGSPVQKNTAVNPTPTSSSSSPNQSNSCIITIQGNQYDVTTLRYTHSGGDVFVCGTDMTTTFFSRHNQRWLDNQMLRYKVN